LLPVVVVFGVFNGIPNAYRPPLKTFAQGSSNLKENSQTQPNPTPLA
jgi:hypothetical protein